MGFDWNSFTSNFFRESDRSVQRERQRGIDARAAEEFDWRRQEQARMAAMRQEEDTAVAGLRNTYAGMGQAQGEAARTYGMTPQQVAATGGIEGLRAKVAQYDAPDNFDLQSTAGMPPRRTAADLQAVAPTRTQMNRGMMGLAMARRDMGAMSTLQKEGGQINEEEVFGVAAKAAMNMKPAELLEMTRDLNKNTKNFVMQPGKGKGGYATIGLITADGDHVSKPLSQQQFAALAGARALLEVNPAKALEIMGKIDKDVADAAAREFEQNLKATGANNTALHYANSDETARMNARTQAAQGNRADFVPAGASEDGAGVSMYDRRTGKFTLSPLPPGVKADSIFPKVSGIKMPPAEKAAARATIISKYVEAGMSMAQAAMRADMDLGDAPQSLAMPGLQGLNAERGSGSPTAGIPPSPQAGRPFMLLDSRQINEMLRGKARLSSAERAGLQDELARRQQEGYLEAR